MLALFLLAAAAPQPGALRPACPPSTLMPVDGRRTVRPRKLGEEPPARLIYTVLRTEDGCVKPVPVNERRYGRR